MNPEPAGTINGAWMPTAVFQSESGVTSERLRKAFGEKNIDARSFFHPLSALPMFVDQGHVANKWASDIPKRAINLPSYHDITSHEMDRVCSVVLEQQ